MSTHRTPEPEKSWNLPKFAGEKLAPLRRIKETAKDKNKVASTIIPHESYVFQTLVIVVLGGQLFNPI
jgi:hypothetical protein